MFIGSGLRLGTDHVVEMEIISTLAPVIVPLHHKTNQPSDLKEKQLVQERKEKRNDLLPEERDT